MRASESDNTEGGEMSEVNMQEAARVILGLRAAGWEEKDINDFILFVETGEEKYKPGKKEKPAE